MFKLFILLSLCAAFAYAAPGLLHASPILSSATYHSLPAVHVVRPVWTSHSLVRPILASPGYGYGHGYANGHGHAW